MKGRFFFFMVGGFGTFLLISKERELNYVHTITMGDKKTSFILELLKCDERIRYAVSTRCIEVPKSNSYCK